MKPGPGQPTRTGAPDAAPGRDRASDPGQEPAPATKNARPGKARAGGRAARIRRATADDCETIHAMVLALADTIGAVDKVTARADDYRRMGFGEDPCFQALIAERGGRPVGLSVYFFSFSTWRGRRGVYLLDIYVADSERGTGLGRRLMAETARRAAEQGARYLRLTVDRDNTGAQRFYEQLGLVYSEAERIYMVKDEAFDALRELDTPE